MILAQAVILEWLEEFWRRTTQWFCTTTANQLESCNRRNGSDRKNSLAQPLPSAAIHGGLRWTAHTLSVIFTNAKGLIGMYVNLS